MVHPRKGVRDVFGVALGQLVARAVLLVRGVVAAAALGPLGYGGWNALNLVLEYGAYASAGALDGMELRLPAAAARGDRARASALLRGAWTVVVAGGTLFALGLAAWLATGARALEAPWGWPAPALMGAAALLQLAIYYHAAALRAHGAFGSVSRALAAQALVGGGLGLLLVAPYGVWGLLSGWIAGGLVALVLLRRAPQAPPLRPDAPREGLALAAAGLPVFAYFGAVLLLRSVDRLAFVRAGATEALGLYGLGLMVAGLVLYLPEATAAVLYPRIAAAAGGARDRARTRDEVARAQRALGLVLPLLVGVGLLWAPPLVGWLLPAFRGAVPSLRVLALGALALAAATLPAYWLLGSGHARLLFGLASAAAAVAAALVFGVAARDPRPVPVAIAAVSAHALFAAALVVAAGRTLFDGVGERWRFIAASFAPACVAGAIVLVLARLAGGDTAGGALRCTAALLVLYLPLFLWLGRGAGLAQIVREWLSPRAASA